MSADGNGGPPGFTIPGMTSSTPWAGVNQDHLYAHTLATDHTWYGLVWFGLVFLFWTFITTDTYVGPGLCYPVQTTRYET